MFWSVTWFLSSLIRTEIYRKIEVAFFFDTPCMNLVLITYGGFGLKIMDICWKLRGKVAQKNWYIG